MKMYFPLSRVELTETGIALVAADESRVELCGKDVWDLLLWMCRHVIELGQRKEVVGQPSNGSLPQLTQES